MAQRDYYEILGLGRSASADEIRKAYRKLARQHHPDLNPNDKAAHQRFQEINEANEVLSDPEKRKKYDQYGKDWQHAEEFEKARQSGQQRSTYSAGSTGGAGFEDEDFSSFFSSMFGGRTGGARNAFRGQDYQAELTLTLREAFTSHQHVLTVNGKNIRITIPAGVENGQVIKLRGHGAPGTNGGPAGDLYITFHIGNEPRLKRAGNDLYADASIDLYTAVLGGETTIESLSGKLKVKVPAGTQPGSKLRLKGKGFPVYKKENETGDLFVVFNVEIPARLTDQQKELFRQLAALK